MIELVWDQQQQGTATAGTGPTMVVGGPAHFSPDELLATAAAGCHMQTFLKVIEEAGVPILSYAATARVHPGGGAARAPRVQVHAYIVAPPGADAHDILALFEQATGRSPIAQVLGGQALFTANVRALHEIESP